MNRHRGECESNSPTAFADYLKTVRRTGTVKLFGLLK